MDQNSIFFLEVDSIPFLGLDLIDPRSSIMYILCVWYHDWKKGYPLILNNKSSEIQNENRKKNLNPGIFFSFDRD